MNKHNSCSWMLGTRAGVQKKNPRSLYVCYVKETDHASFFSGTRVTLSMMVLLYFVGIVLGDDTQALQGTLASLCSLNKNGVFGSCCGSYQNGCSVTLASSTARNCFISGLGSTTGSTLTLLFVFQTVPLL